MNVQPLADTKTKFLVDQKGVQQDHAPAFVNTKNGLTLTDFSSTFSDGDFHLAPGKGQRFIREIRLPPGMPLFWHQTDSKDQVYVSKGHVTLHVKDQGKIRLKAGDFLEVNRVFHAWENNGKSVAVLLSISSYR